MWKANAIEDAMKPDFSEVNGVGIGTSVDDTRIIDNNKPEAIEIEVYNIAREKKTKDGNSKIYYAF